MIAYPTYGGALVAAAAPAPAPPSPPRACTMKPFSLVKDQKGAGEMTLDELNRRINHPGPPGPQTPPGAAWVR